MRHKLILLAILAVFAGAQSVFARSDVSVRHNDSIRHDASVRLLRSGLPAAVAEPGETAATAEPAGSGVGDDGPMRPKFLWGVQFDTRFDNHENDELRYLAPAVNSMTLFSIRLAPTVGIGWGDRHSLYTGVSTILDISQRMAARPVEPLVYYNYHDDRFDLFAGKFERRHLIGGYSRAIFAGIATFYDNVVDGFALQYHPAQGKLELVLDWDGIKTATSRERFRVLSAGEFTPVKSRAMRWFAIGYSFDLYHLASSLGGGEGVVDHFAVNPWIGADFHRLGGPFDILSLQVGWFQTADRDRMGADSWLTPGGVTVDATIEKWRVGIKNRLYYGQPLMPLRAILGVPTASMIYRGDPFYSAIAVTKVYNYTYVYWKPRIGHGVALEVSVGLHTDGKKVGIQQTAAVGVTFDHKFFTKNSRKK